MRLKIVLETRGEATLPIDHREILHGLLYRLLGAGDSEYARCVHDQGCLGAREGESQRPLKPFTFSGLRVPRERRRLSGERIVFAPGQALWWIGSPLPAFLHYAVQGLFSLGDKPLDIAGTCWRVVSVESVPTPSFATGTAAFTCLTPMVAAVPSPDGRPTPYYLRPHDGVAFNESVRTNLLRKYTRIYSEPPPADRLEMAFDTAYIARHPQGATQLWNVHGESVVGALAPFTLTGAPELLRLAWDAGLGSKTGCGFGMNEITQ